MKRFGVAVFIIFFITGTAVWSIGIGIQGGFNAGPNLTGDIAVTVKLDTVPLAFSGSFIFDSSKLGFGITGDYWVINNTFIAASFKWYIGCGLYTNMLFNNPFGISAGVRLPLGINASFLNGSIEPYFQIAPSMGFTFLPTAKFPDWFFPVNLGVRLWLQSPQAKPERSIK